LGVSRTGFVVFKLIATFGSKHTRRHAYNN
jgi:hypothetical protein